MVGRLSQVLRSHCRDLDKFVRRTYCTSLMESDFLLFQNVFWRRTSFLSRVAIRVRNR